MTPDEIATGRALLHHEKATPRPWTVTREGLVSEWPGAHRPNMNARDVISYGGYLVAESMGPDDRALAALLANHAEELLDAAEIICILDRLAGLGTTEVTIGDDRTKEPCHYAGGRGVGRPNPTVSAPSRLEALNRLLDQAMEDIPF